MSLHKCLDDRDEHIIYLGVFLKEFQATREIASLFVLF